MNTQRSAQLPTLNKLTSNASLLPTKQLSVRALNRENARLLRKFKTISNRLNEYLMMHSPRQMTRPKPDNYEK